MKQKKFTLEETVEIAQCCEDMTRIKTKLAGIMALYAGFSESKDVTFSGSSDEQAHLYISLEKYRETLIRFNQTVPKEVQDRLVFLELEKLAKFGKRFNDFYQGKPVNKSEITYFENF